MITSSRDASSGDSTEEAPAIDAIGLGLIFSCFADKVISLACALPAGSLGLRSATRTRAAAYWASWVDTLPVLAAKSDDLLALALAQLSSDHTTADCLREAKSAAAQLTAAGVELPSWEEAATGVTPATAAKATEEETFEAGWLVGGTNLNWPS